MSILRKDGDAHQVYEHVEKGILVAVSRENQKLIKQYWKKYKGKSEQPADEVPGFPFVNDDDQESLRVDFDSPSQYEIKSLKKFD